MNEGEHEHVWGPWLIGPYFPDAIVRRCECGAKDRQEVEEVVECPACDGEGVVFYAFHLGLPDRWVPCPDCPRGAAAERLLYRPEPSDN